MTALVKRIYDNPAKEDSEKKAGGGT